MGKLGDGDARDAARWLADALTAYGYEASPLGEGHGWFATKRGHSFGPFLPYTDFVFVHDLDSENIEDGPALDALHEAHRVFGEGQMRVPRAFRYRVPNTVTIGISAREFPEAMIHVATRSRHAVNSGEKNAVFLLELSTGRVYSQGFERDPLRYGGTWVTTVNPSNRMMALLATIFAEMPALGARDASEAVG
jgi:hypothetical protein